MRIGQVKLRNLPALLSALCFHCWLASACSSSKNESLAVGILDISSTKIGAGIGTFQAETAVAASGDVVVIAYMDQKNPTFTGAENAARIMAVVSKDRGETYGTPFEVGEGTLYDRFDPTVTISPAGHASIGWFEDNGQDGGRHVRVATASTPEGPYVTAPTFDDSLPLADRPWIAVTGDGTIYVAWTASPSNCKHCIYVARSEDGGQSFELIYSSLSEGAWVGCILASPDGTLYLGVNRFEDVEQGSVELHRSTDGGATFSSISVANAPGNTKDTRFLVSCALTPTGGIVLVWPKRLGTTSEFSANILDAQLQLAWSPEGQTFGPLFAMPSPEGKQPLSVPAPAIFVTPEGKASILFYARKKNGASLDEEWDLYVGTAPANSNVDQIGRISTSSFPGIRPASISPLKLDPLRWLGDTVGIVGINGFLFLAYSDTRDGDPDVFAGRIANP